MKNFSRKVWGVLGKQQSFKPNIFQGQTLPLNVNPLESWDTRKSRYRRVDLVPKAEQALENMQQGGVVEQTGIPPVVTPSPTSTSVTPTGTPTNTATPTNTPTNTSTNTPTGTPTNTPTETSTSTPTNTPTNTSTPSETPTNTPTPTVTPTEPYDVYEFEECGNPSNIFRYENVPGTLTLGAVYLISGGVNFNGYATVITYTGSGPVYPGGSVTFTIQGACPTPTPTPTPTTTETPTNTPTSTETPTQTSTETPTETPTNTPTTTETPTNTPTQTSTETPTNTPTNTETPTNTPTQTSTNTPTNTSTPTQTSTTTPTPTSTGGGGGFSPSDISDLIGWWKADAGVNTTGSLVDSWDDQTTIIGDFNFITGNKATYNSTGFGINNKPYVSLPYNQTLTLYRSTNNWVASAATVYIVGEFQNVTGGAYYRYMECNNFGAGFIMLNENGSDSQTNLGFCSDLTTSLAPGFGNPFCMRVVWDTTTNKIRLDGGTELSTVSVLGSQPSNELCLFNLENANYGNGWDVAEIIIYNKVCSAGELSDLNDYVTTKYGIAINPPPSPTPTVTPTNTPTTTPSPTPIPPLLDTYPSAAFAFSVRKLRTAYSGSSMRVRRSSDNTEQDIGFDGNGNLDTSALTSFVGANDGFVTIWYDQSGNGRNFVQPTNADQPRIVLNGTVDVLTGVGSSKPGIKFISNDYLSGSTLSSYSSASIFASIKSDSTGGFGFWNFNEDDGGASHHPFSPTDAYEGAFKTDRPQVSVPSNSLLNLHIWGVTSASNDYKVSLNNSNQYTSTSSTVKTSVGSPFIGKANGPAWFPGSFQEVVCWFSNQDSNRSGIVSDMNTYFGVY